MFKLFSLTLVALAAVSTANAAALFARKTPPAGWIAEILEPYDDYNTRYLAVGCQNKHNTQFFDDCCHPMKKGETLEKNRKAYCRPGSDPAPSSSGPMPPVNTLVGKPTPTTPSSQPTPVPDEGDDCEDDDDENDDDNDGEDGDDDEDGDCEDEPVPTPKPSPTPVNPSPPPVSTPKDPNPVQPSPPKPSPSNDPKPSPNPQNPSSETHTGGHVTWFTQNGNAGACGDKHSDNDFVAALDYRTYGNTGAKSKYCGQKIRVSWQGKSVDVIVADACPSCENSASVDLSVAAFKALAPLDVGELNDISWQLL